MGGTSNAGRVEVSVNGQWGSVCRRYFDNNEATVLCRTLGYNVGTADYRTTYPNATGPVYEADFRCTGQENSLAQCPHAGWRTSTFSYCSNHRYDAAVVCLDNIKLATGFAPGIKQGPVQVWSNNTWHYVCDTNFDDLTAKTVCRKLGFVDGKALCCSAYGSKYVPYSYNGNGPGTILSNMTMQCDGSQTDPMTCLRPGTCSNNYASVVCFNSSDIMDEVYSFGFDDTNSSSGQVVAQHYGIRGRICSTFWTDTEATVFCKALNYVTGIAYHHSVTYNYQPIRSRGPFWLSAVNCTGTESSLSACTYGDRMTLGNCSTADIASAICYNGNSGIQYRLVAPDNSTDKNYGRVEMSIGGVWGTVCDRYFDRREAEVFCRQQGFKDGYAIPNAYYGKGSGPMWLSSLQCTGTETSLHQCPHSGFNSEVVSGDNFFWCRSHIYDVSVYCVDTLKLNTGMNASMGAVEIYASDHWNTVCEDGFNSNTATVICRTLGYQFGTSIGGSVFGITDGHIGISNLECNGLEPDIKGCTITSSTICSSGEYVSVICSNEAFVDDGFKLRISSDDPVSNTHGFLEAKINGIWGSICGTDFTDSSANIACRQLSFSGGVAYRPAVVNPIDSRGQTILTETSPILMTQIMCTSNENSLENCRNSRSTNISWCDYYAPRAGILCYQRERIEYRLAGDSNTALQGRIEMKYDGQWGTLCDPAGYSNAAKITCKSLGHKDGLPLSNTRYIVPNDNRPVWFHYFRCFGNETSLPTCRNDGFNNSASIYRRQMGNYCRSFGPTAAKCYDKDIKVTDIRLANGPTNNSGRVEIFLQGPDKWGTICDNYWDDKDATVVCMMFGYARGKAFGRAVYGQGTGPIWMENMGCKGNESHIQDCPYNGFAVQNCRHTEDASVQCSGVIPPSTTSTTTRSTTTTTTTTTITPTATSTTTTPTSTSTTTTPITTTTTMTTTTTSTTTTTTTTTTTPTATSTTTTPIATSITTTPTSTSKTTTPTMTTTTTMTTTPTSTTTTNTTTTTTPTATITTTTPIATSTTTTPTSTSKTTTPTTTTTMTTTTPTSTTMTTMTTITPTTATTTLPTTVITTTTASTTARTTTTTPSTSTTTPAVTTGSVVTDFTYTQLITVVTGRRDDATPAFSKGPPAVAIAVPTILILAIAAAVLGFLFYKRGFQLFRRPFSNRSGMNTELVTPSLPRASNTYGASTNADPDISGVINPTYESSPVTHANNA